VRIRGKVSAEIMGIVVTLGMAVLTACATGVGIPSDVEKEPAQQKASEKRAEPAKARDLSKVSPELKAALQAFKEQYEVYWKKVLKQQHMGGDVAQPCARPDALLRDLVFQAFREGLALTDIQQFLKGVVDYQELPERISYAMSTTKGLERGQLEKVDPSSLPLILFAQLTAASGATVTVFQNTFLVDYHNIYLRQRLEPYVVVAFPDSVECSVLTADYTRQFAGEGPFFEFEVLDVVEVGFALPAVAVMQSPWAMGNEFYLYAFAFDVESRIWRHVNTKQWSGGLLWKYSRSQHALLKAVGPTEDFDVGPFVREGVAVTKKGRF